MHEVVYSPLLMNISEVKNSCQGRNFNFMHENEVFMHGISMPRFLCMKHFVRVVMV